MLKPDKPHIAIIGSGPIGLEAALQAKQFGYPVTVYERGRLADSMQRRGHIRLFSPFGMNATTAGKQAILVETPGHQFPKDDECITGRQHVQTYLEPLAKSRLLKDVIRTENQVVYIGRHRLLKNESPGDGKRGLQPFLLMIRERGKERYEEADVVLDCSGTYPNHRWIGDGGIPAPGEITSSAQISYGLDDILGEKKNHYAGKSVMVIGGGYSAATTVCNLAELAGDYPDTWVIWLARCQGTTPLKRVMNDPLKERDRLAVRANKLATRTDANVEFHANTVIRGVESLGPDRGFRVAAQVGKYEQTWDVDRIIGNVGYSPDNSIYRELQVHECYASLGPMKLAAALLGETASDCLKQVSHGPDTLRNPEPNFYILGMKSYGRNSHFLMKIGFEQVREVFTLIRGKK